MKRTKSMLADTHGDTRKHPAYSQMLGSKATALCQRAAMLLVHIRLTELVTNTDFSFFFLGDVPPGSGSLSRVPQILVAQIKFQSFLYSSTLAPVNHSIPTKSSNQQCSLY